MAYLALVGSFRKGSYNRSVFEFYREMVSADVEIVEGKFDDFPLYNDDLRESGPPETILRLSEQVRRSEGVLFFSPEYNYSVPGPLKNMIDWLSKLPNQPFANKPVSIISASPGKIGGARMQYHLRQIGVFLEMNILNRPEVMISEVHKKVTDGKFTDEETQKFLKKHFEAFQKFTQGSAQVQFKK